MAITRCVHVVYMCIVPVLALLPLILSIPSPDIPHATCTHAGYNIAFGIHHPAFFDSLPPAPVCGQQYLRVLVLAVGPFRCSHPIPSHLISYNVFSFLGLVMVLVWGPVGVPIIYISTRVTATITSTWWRSCSPGMTRRRCGASTSACRNASPSSRSSEYLLDCQESTIMQSSTYVPHMDAVFRISLASSGALSQGTYRLCLHRFSS